MTTKIKNDNAEFFQAMDSLTLNYIILNRST